MSPRSLRENTNGKKVVKTLETNKQTFNFREDAQNEMDDVRIKRIKPVIPPQILMEDVFMSPAALLTVKAARTEVKKLKDLIYRRYIIWSTGRYIFILSTSLLPPISCFMLRSNEYHLLLH